VLDRTISSTGGPDVAVDQPADGGVVSGSQIGHWSRNGFCTMVPSTLAGAREHGARRRLRLRKNGEAVRAEGHFLEAGDHPTVTSLRLLEQTNPDDGVKTLIAVAKPVNWTRPGDANVMTWPALHSARQIQADDIAASCDEAWNEISRAATGIEVVPSVSSRVAR
jgi:hypothetical protein